MPARVKFRTILTESACLYFIKGGILPKILLIAGVATAAIFIVTATAMLGSPAEAAILDPAVFRNSMTGQQWAIGAAGLVAGMMVLSFVFAASVHAAAGARSVGEAFGRIRSGPMQIFWLQCVINVFALKFTALAAPLLFLLIAFAVPVALHEGLGPNAAADRAWTLSEGRRTSILLLELGAMLATTAVMVLSGALFLRPTSPLVFLPRLMHIAISWIFMALLIAPFQFLFVALTRLYEAVSAPVLHARAASSVNS